MLARRWPVVLFFLLFISAGSFADSSSDFAEANRLYEQAKFGEAIRKYESVSKSGRVSAPLFFNLGNACFKNGELGRAIYYYRLAQALSPRDPDIQANLRFARDRITGSASVAEAGWVRIVSFLKLNELSAVAMFCFWVLLALLSITRWRPSLQPTLRPFVLPVAALFLLSIIVLALAWSAAQAPVAIATQRQTVIHLGPLAESQESFTVPDGTELRVENRREDWLQVSDRSNRTGWIESSKVLTLP